MRRDGNANTDPRVVLEAGLLRLGQSWRERCAALEGRAQHNPDHGPLLLPGRCRSYDQRPDFGPSGVVERVEIGCVGAVGRFAVCGMCCRFKAPPFGWRDLIAMSNELRTGQEITYILHRKTLHIGHRANPRAKSGTIVGGPPPLLVTAALVTAALVTAARRVRIGMLVAETSRGVGQRSR